MGTKKARLFVETVGEMREEKPKDILEEGEDNAMEEAVRDFAEGERFVKLYRYQGPLGGRPGLLCALAREDFNDVYVQERFGGGEYFGRWKNKKGLYTRFNFKIEGVPKVLVERDNTGEQDEGEHAQPYRYLGSGSGELEPAPSQASGAISMIDVLRMLSETRRESREEMRSLLEMMRPAAAPPNATEQVFSLVKELLPLMQGGGDGSTGNTMVDALIRLKDPIMKALETAQMALSKAPVQPMQPAPGSVVRPLVADKVVGAVAHGQPLQATPEPQQPMVIEQPTEGGMLAESFKGFLPMFVKAASEGHDTSLYCDVVLAQVPVFGYARLRRWLVTAGCLDDLAKFEPIISADPNQRDWWEDLRKQIILAINEELGDAPSDVQPKPHSDPSTPGATDSA